MITWREWFVLCWSLSSDAVLFNGEIVYPVSGKRVSLLIQLATLVGILVIITVSYHSLIHTRRAAVRESLEQLDDIRFATRSDVKVKPILYRCRGLVFRRACEVKFKFYGAATSGASDPSAFIEFPEAVFSDYDVRTESDGYVVTIASNNPVEIRRKANEIMLEMYSYEESDSDRKSDTSR